MADPVSIAASAASFLSLAGHLADGIIKLKDMCATISNASKDLSDLCSRMDLLRGLLEEAGQQLQLLSLNDMDKAIATRVFAQCEEARYKVAARVADLSTKIQRNQAAAIKFCFRKKELQEMRSNVARCRSDIIIARQTIES